MAKKLIQLGKMCDCAEIVAKFWLLTVCYLLNSFAIGYTVQDGVPNMLPLSYISPLLDRCRSNKSSWYLFS